MSYRGMLFSRSGPTDTIEIRTPANSSIRFKYDWQLAGKSSNRLMREMSSFQPGSTS